MQVPDYDSMPAGADLDALVAEKVMGCTVGWIEVESFEEKRPHCLCQVDYSLEFKRPHDGWWERLFRYSEDIAAAWLVLGRFLGYVVDGQPNRCAASVFNEDGKNFYSDAPTASLAIARAALKAVGHTSP